MQKSLPLREPTFNHEVIDCVLRTRGARSGFRLNRTLDAPGDSNDGASGRSLHSCPKPKNLPHFCVPPPTPSRFLKKERFLVLVRRFVFQKAPFNLHLLESFHFAFFRLHADPRSFARSSVVVKVLHTLTNPPSPRISTLAFARVACSVVTVVRFSFKNSYRAIVLSFHKC